MGISLSFWLREVLKKLSKQFNLLILDKPKIYQSCDMQFHLPKYINKLKIICKPVWSIYWLICYIIDLYNG